MYSQYQTQRQKRVERRNSNIATSIVVILVAVGLFFALKVGLDRQAVVDCYKWQRYAKEYQLFEPSADMISECHALGVEVSK